MSRPGNPGAAGTGQARQYRAPAGLLEKLMAAVRPEFRSGDLVFDPRDPVFGGPPCAVNGCDRPHRVQGLCTAHWQRWRGSGRLLPLAEFTATADPAWHGHLPLRACVIAGCNYGQKARGLCQRHHRQWCYAGRPDMPGWQAADRPLLPSAGPPPACRISYCSLWAQGTSVFCHGHDSRWKYKGRPGLDEFAASCENPGPAHPAPIGDLGHRNPGHAFQHGPVSLLSHTQLGIGALATAGCASWLPGGQGTSSPGASASSACAPAGPAPPRCSSSPPACPPRSWPAC